MAEQPLHLASRSPLQSESASSRRSSRSLQACGCRGDQRFSASVQCVCAGSRGFNVAEPAAQWVARMALISLVAARIMPRLLVRHTERPHIS